MGYQRNGADLMSAIQQVLAGGQTPSGSTLSAAITAAGETANLQLCLDAGDSSSYTSGQSWLDRSGNGYDFFLGATVGSEASDPTFTGSAGYLGSYWACDGGDFFKYDSANETWMQNLHKNNAAYTILAIFYGPNGYICGTNGGAGNTGIFVAHQTNKLNFRVENAGSIVLSVTHDTALSSGYPHFVALSLNEATGAGGGFMWADGNYLQVSASDTFNSTYTSPAAGNATYTMELASLGNASSTANGSRLMGFAVWSRALSKASLDTIYSSIQGRY